MPPTHEQFRAIGFTGDAVQYPRDELAIRMFAAFNGVEVEQLPETFKYFPNEATAAAWARVGEHYTRHVENEAKVVRAFAGKKKRSPEQQ